jgi:ketosteroid isomerase-like protein
VRPASAILCVVTAALACSTAADPAAEGSELSPEAARELYEAYEAALRARRADTLAAFYHPEGASIIVNGNRMDLSNAGIDSVYRGNWQGPTYFAFEDLDFDQLNRTQVLVTGHFRWLVPEAVDTGRVIYLAVVEQTDVGPRIRVEHETPRQSLATPNAVTDSADRR